MPSTLLRLLRDDWRKSYRYHGGVRAVYRCYSGDRRLRRGKALAKPEVTPALDCTVFSVVPELSALWAAMFERVIRLRPLRVLLGDCSGGLGAPPPGSDTCLVTPLLNRHHGEKLDLFFEHLCRADVVMATDDDIFWLSEEPLRWALERFAADPEIAVVALAPKHGTTEVLEGKVERPMGSILVIRRGLWMREGLLFRIAHPPPEEGLTWIYDTGEFAQVELGRRGYRVELAPEDFRRHFVHLTGISSWALKLQRFQGEIGAAVGKHRGRQRKALQTVLVLRSLARIYAHLPGRRSTRLISPAFLDRAEKICEDLLAPEVAEATRKWVEFAMGLIRYRLFGFDDLEQLARTVDHMLAGH